MTIDIWHAFFMALAALAIGFEAGGRFVSREQPRPAAPDPHGEPHGDVSHVPGPRK